MKHSLLVFVLLTGSPLFAVEKTEPLAFGVFPYLAPAQLEKLFAPIAADLAKAIGRPVQLRTRPSFEMFRAELSRQRYDLIFIQPFGYVTHAAPNNYRSIAQMIIPLSAIFVTRSDSTYDSFDDFKGQTISNPPKTAAVSRLARQTLANHNLLPGTDVRLTYQNSHAACLREVLIRRAAACVTAMSPLKVFEAKSQIQFQIFALSDSIPGSTFAIHKRVPNSTRSALAERITQWGQTVSGKRMLEQLKIPGYQPSSDEDYQPVRDIANTLNIPLAAKKPATDENTSN